ncbi:AlpA family phage regulatory protein [Sphingomonas sp. RT2P30]|uniref:helix-turn-helix transcriptional regulator n=1 Tax=Parasphingomonas halimpatiens TaxID=3096162 RepID=UPI002FC61E9A
MTLFGQASAPGASERARENYFSPPDKRPETPCCARPRQGAPALIPALLISAESCLKLLNRGAKRPAKCETYPMSDEPKDCIIRLKAVLKRTGLSRSTMYRKVENGTFPKQIKISDRCVGWSEFAVEAWLRNPMFYSAEEGR